MTFSATAITCAILAIFILTQDNIAKAGIATLIVYKPLLNL
jgi:hypothetical protein